MSEIIEELTIETIPENAFYALTTSNGISKWWSNHVTAEPQIGTLTEVSFENGGVFQLEIIDLQASKKVSWKVRHSPHDWEGSTITWDIMPIPMGTRLIFHQHELFVGPSGYSIEESRAGWQYFLLSLKSYLETGKGTPYVY